MEYNEFNEMPKDTMMIIGNMDKFVEFVVFNVVQKTVNKLMFNLFNKQSYAVKLVEKYVVKHNIFLKESSNKEIEKYIIKNDDDNEDEENEFKDKLEFEQDMNDLGAICQIKRGDIDKIVIGLSYALQYMILNDMCNDKLVKLCWDKDTSDFVWAMRSPNEPDKIETKYVSSPKKKIKKIK